MSSYLTTLRIFRVKTLSLIVSFGKEKGKAIDLDISSVMLGAKEANTGKDKIKF
jgi:hypothetical protein